MNRDKIKALIKSSLPKPLSHWLIDFYRKHISHVLISYKKRKYKNFDIDTPQAFDINEHHFELFINPKNGYVDIAMLEGRYETEIFKLLADELLPDMNFLDIGANIGVFTNYVAKYCKEVYAFEPIASIYNQNKKSIEANGYNNLYNYGAGNNNETKDISIDSNTIGCSSLCNEIRGKEKEAIKIVKLDEFLGEKKINFLKVDVEGYEYEVLKGIKQIISKNSPKIILEFSPHFYNRIDPSISNDILDFLICNGYEINEIGPNAELKPIGDPKEYIKTLSDTIGQSNLYCVNR